MKFQRKGIRIEADLIDIGKGVILGEGIDVKVRGVFRLGDYSRLGQCEIRGEEVIFGKHFYHSQGLRIGGGGRNEFSAILTVGDRCTFHNNFINVCEPVLIGSDVGLSQDVSIITHGYWQNVMMGYPRKYAPVNIQRGCILGYRSVVLPGVSIAKNSVIGASSVVTKPLLETGIYAGSPARLIRTIQEPTRVQKRELFNEIFFELEAKFDIKPEYPAIRLGDFAVNTHTSYHEGEENEETDRFRDALRKYGIRVYTERPFG